MSMIAMLLAGSVISETFMMALMTELSLMPGMMPMMTGMSLTTVRSL
jgi:hypothetical protein